MSEADTLLDESLRMLESASTRVSSALLWARQARQAEALRAYNGATARHAVAVAIADLTRAQQALDVVLTEVLRGG